MEIGIVRRGAPKIVQAEPPSQRHSGHWLDVFRPEPFQVSPCLIRPREPRFMAGMKPDQQPFEIRPEVDQLQIRAPCYRLRVAAGGAILR